MPVEYDRNGRPIAGDDPVEYDRNGRPITSAHRRRVAEQAGQRHLNRAMTPMGLGGITQPFVEAITDPEARSVMGDSVRGFVRDVRQVPNLDFGRLAQDTGAAIEQGVQDFLPRTLPGIVAALPGLPRALTYGPFEDNERNLQRRDLARAQGDVAGSREATGAALGNTAQAGLNILGPAAFAGPQSVLRAGATAAALDAPFALARNSDQPLQERLPGALTEIGGVGAFGAGLQSIANGGGALARRSEGITNTIRERAGQFAEANVRPFLAAVSGRGGRSTMQLAENPIGGNVRTNLRNSLNDVVASRDRLAHRFGEPQTPELAGEVLQRGVQRFANGAGRGIETPQPRAGRAASTPVQDWTFPDKARAIYDPIFEALGADERQMILGQVEGPILSTDATMNALGSMLSIAGTRSGQRMGSPYLRSAMSDLQSDLADGSLRFETLRRMRTEVREMQHGDTALRQGMSAGELKRLEGALSEDIYRSAEQINPGAAAELRIADRWYRTITNRIDRALQPLADAATGTTAFNRLRQLASTRGSSRRILEVRNSLKPDEWRTVAAAYINDMGRGSDGNFSLARFVHEYRGRNGMSPEGRRAMFGGDSMGTLHQDLERLVDVARYMDEVKGFTNWSNSGASLQSFWTSTAAIGAAGAAAAGQYVPALGVALWAVASRLQGELLTNPVLVRWLNGAPKAGQSSTAARAHLARLVQLSARDPALAPVVADLVQHGLVANDNQAGTPQQRAAPYR